MPDQPSSQPTLAPGKLAPPRAHPWQIARTELLERLATQIGGVVLLRAAPGFGKTTLLAQYLARCRHSGRPAIWLNLDRNDNDLSRLLRALAAALTPLGLGCDAKTDDALAWQTLDGLARHPAGIVIVLDEMEHLTDPAALDFISRLASQLGSQSQLLLGARHLPALPWHRWRLQGRLLELDASELGFSLEETGRFLGRDGLPVLAAADVHLLHSKTEGWVASLWLASLSLARQSDELHPKGWTPSNLWGVFHDEVRRGFPGMTGCWRNTCRTMSSTSSRRKSRVSCWPPASSNAWNHPCARRCCPMPLAPPSWPS